MAVSAVAGPMLAAIEVGLGRPVNVVANQQVEIPVLVVIEPARAGGPLALVADAGFGGHIREGAVPVIVVKDGPAVAGDVKVGIAVVVVVAHGHALPVEALGAHTSLFRHVRKGPIAIVMIKGGAQRVRRLVPLGLRRLHKIKVHQSVLVVINPTQAAAHGLEIVFFRSESMVVLEGDASDLTDVRKADGNRGGLGRLGAQEFQRHNAG